MRVDKLQMMNLRDICLRYAVPVSSGEGTELTINRENFHKAMSEVGIDELDVDILDQLFTMWDKTGAGFVKVVLFLCGVSPLASTLDVITKMRFAMEMYDIKQTGRLSQLDLIMILGGINATASYFGDACITPSQIELVVEECFQGKDEFYYRENIEYIATHPSIVQFSNGAGTMRYGTGKSVS